MNQETIIEFSGLVEKWRRDTLRSSVLAHRYKHPAYQKILAMGPPAVPLILDELRRRPDRWFCALRELTGFNDIGPSYTFDEAVEAWLTWGIINGHI